MKTPRNLGMLVLAIWLIATGLLPLLKIKFSASDTILAILAIAAGVLLLLDVRRMNLRQNLGMLLLAIWLIATGVLVFVHVPIPAVGTILALVAIAAGVLLLLRR